jgi:hypothetical protein
VIAQGETTSNVSVIFPRFGANIMNDQSYVDIYPSTRLRNVPVSVQSMLQRVQRQEKGVFRTGSRVPTDPMTVQSILKWVEDPEVSSEILCSPSTLFLCFISLGKRSEGPTKWGGSSFFVPPLTSGPLWESSVSSFCQLLFVNTVDARSVGNCEQTNILQVRRHSYLAGYALWATGD